MLGGLVRVVRRPSPRCRVVCLAFVTALLLQFCARRFVERVNNFFCDFPQLIVCRARPVRYNLGPRSLRCADHDRHRVRVFPAGCAGIMANAL